MTLDEARRLAAQFPPLIPIETAGALVGMSRTGSYVAAARGELPVLAFGRRRMVVTARWLAILGLDPGHDEGAPEGASIDKLTPAATTADEDHHGS